MIDTLGTSGNNLLSDGAIWRSLGMLVLVLVLLVAAVWFLRRLQRGTSARTLDLEIMGRLPLAPKQHLSVVRVGKDMWVLGVSENAIQYIGDYHGELPAATATQSSGVAGAFEAKLRRFGEKLSAKRAQTPQVAR